MKHLDFKKEKGLTMIELVISLFVLTVAVFGIYNAFSVMVVTTAQMSDKFIAAYLAQEGIEVIRNIRDNNWLNPSDPENPDWTEGFFSCGQTQCDWQADYDDTATLTTWSGDDETGGAKLNINEDGFYSYNTGDQTKFRRKITIAPIENDVGEIYALKVTATVFWDEKPTIFNFEKSYGSITAEDYLYNWY